MTSAACPSFVDFVERGVTSGRQLLGLAQSYLDPLLAAGVDTVVLGCTHYPLLTGVLSLVLGDDVTLVSSAEETAKDVYRVLTRADLLRDEDGPPPEHRFLATGDPEPFARLGRRFLGPEVGVGAARGDGGRAREAHRRRLLGQRARAEVRRRPATWSSTTASGCCSTSATARSARCRAVADPARVDAVFLSHLHADHCLDVAPFVVWHRYSGRSSEDAGAAVRAGRRRAAAGAGLRRRRRRDHRRLRLRRRSGRARSPSARSR